ncbi:ubiquitin-activating enzyme E1 [Neoconidiobolus thromboides FSU 785]|nr:ubiquitin-activating enzyme E1 [Neoconidiobolus thromboides FSU 785]
MSDKNPKIDEGLYSRQLYVLGHEAMNRMANSHVLILGLNGLGVEIAKNVILAGVKSVTLHDDQPTELKDLSTQFYLTESDIGKPRASCTAEKLKLLNQYVPVHVISGDIDEQTVKKYQAIVTTEISLQNQIQINEWARKYEAKFIAADIFGLFGMVFNDFGSNFKCLDPTGNPPKTAMIASITNDKDGVVTCLEDTRHGLEDGDLVTFSEVQGMEGINESGPFKIKYLGPFTFSIGDLSNYTNYKIGGVFTQVKTPKEIQFKNLLESLKEPEFVISDFAKFDRPIQLHIGFQALHQFKQLNHDKLPKPRNEEDAIKMLELANKINNELKQPIQLDDKLIKELAYQSNGAFAPMAAVIGGIVAQEVLKAVSGKFHPIQQYLYFDSLESLPKNFNINESNVQPINSRYDGQIAIFGKEYQQVLQNCNQFLVGSGAIGCEMLKNWALIGLGSGKEGMIHITDMDTIEKSNLNRQFLFRSKDVGQLKSQTAANAIIEMNPELKNSIKAYSDRVGNETENVYSDTFFNKIDFVTNALDNIDARQYMDSRCVYYSKPLLESGTLGTLGNTQVVIPNMTESYSSSHDPPEKSIPMCTLKSFPNKIEHTIQWARDLFENKFKQNMENTIAYLENQEQFINSTRKQGNTAKETFESVKNSLIDEKPNNFEDCIEFARFLFEELYNNTIQQLLFTFPKDTVTSSGTLFWSGPKRAPKPIKFDVNDPLHLEFIIATANLRAFNFNILENRNIDFIKQAVNNINVPEFIPKAGVKIQVNDNDPINQDLEDDDVDNIIQLIANNSNNFNNIKVNAADFEKDDDSNFHIDFITSASNLRARNYEISEADRHTTKGIAGKIIPAIATTTSLITGLVCLEMIKIVDHIKSKEPSKRTIEDFKNAFVNLATPFVGFSEPIAAPKMKFMDTEFTLWDKYYIEEDLTVQELIDYCYEKYELELNMISYGACMLYSDFIKTTTTPERLNMKLSKACELVSKSKFGDHVSHINIEIMGTTKDGEDVEVSGLRVKL